MGKFKIIIICFICISLSVIPVYAGDTGLKVKIWRLKLINDKETLFAVYESFNDSRHTPQGVLNYLFKGESYQPKILAIKHDIAYINIEGDASFITSRSGSSGSRDFSALVVFNLTEFDSINSVYFIDSGDHFSGGLCDRLCFWRMMSNDTKLSYKNHLEEMLYPSVDNILSYVRYLGDIGDRKSIAELRYLLETDENDNFSLCDMTLNEFKNEVKESINKINQRLKLRK